MFYQKMRITILSCIIVLFISACKFESKDKLTIAVASNMRFAMEELTESFEQEKGIECNLIISSSGKLMAQIKEGAPYDVFISAKMKYANQLFEQGISDKPKVFALGSLVLWSTIDSLYPSVELLMEEYIKHIAIANPQTAPYGEASIEVLKYYDLYDRLEGKLVFGESISQCNQFIMSKAVEIGFTSQSTVSSSKVKNDGQWMVIDTLAYAPIKHGVAILKNDRNLNVEANAFLKYLHSDKGNSILKKYAYKTD